MSPVVVCLVEVWREFVELSGDIGIVFHTVECGSPVIVELRCLVECGAPQG
jgi:hypothetical protein